MDAQKLVHDVEVHKLGGDWMPTRSMAQDGRPVKGNDCILPTVQMKDTSLRVEPLHQSLRYRMPHGIGQSP